MLQSRAASMDSPTSKDIVLAVLSGSVSLAGLLLVFSGFLFTQAEGFDSDQTPDATINRYKKAARFGAIPFTLCIILAGISVLWLLYQAPILFSLSWIGFLALLVLTAVYGVFTVLKYL